MTNRIKIKRSSTPGSIPSIIDLELGELAANTSDGKIFFKKDNGTETIIKLLNEQDISTDSSFNNASDILIPSQKAVHEADALTSSTGVIFGGVLTKSGTTTFDISAGYGVITNTANGARSQVFISWPGITGITPTNLTTENVTYIAINSDAEVVEQHFSYTPEQSRSLLILGIIVHTDRASVIAANNQQHSVLHPINQLHDMVTSLGIININGNVFTPNGNNLLINKSAGSLFGTGFNFAINQNNPNIKVTGEQIGLTFQYRTQTGISTGNLTSINPGIYDLNGVLTTVPDNYYTTQRIYLFPSNGTRIQPSQHLYNSMAEAKGSIQTEDFVLDGNIKENSILRGFLVLKWNATDLSDPSQAFFLECGKFNTAVGVGGLSVTTLQAAYNNSTEATIVTDDTLGALNVKQGGSDNNDIVFGVQDDTGNQLFYVKGSGETSLDVLFDEKVDKVPGYSLTKNDLTDAIYDDLVAQNYIRNETMSAVQVSGGTITPTGGINFQISPGVGYAKNLSGKFIRVTWGTLNSSTINNGDNFINVDYTGNVVITSSAESGDLIALGYISTALSNSVIVGYSNARLTGTNHLFNIGEWLRSTIGSLVQSGCNTAMQASPNQLKITVGSGFIWTLLSRYTISDTSTFTKLVKSSDYGFFVDTLTTANTVNTAFWNNTNNPAVSALVPLTTGYYKKDLIALTPEGSVFYIYGSSEWATVDEAKLAPVPAVPDNIKLAVVRSASIIVQQGATSITELFDIRPMISRLFDTGQAAANATVISHSNLIDLNNDDHLIYLTDARGDIRYYKKSDVDTLIAGRAPVVHMHVATDITGLVPSSVGLGNVVNVDQTVAHNITSGTLANARLTINLSQLGGISFTANDLIQYNGSTLVALTVSALKTQLQLNNVVNNLQVINAGNGTSLASGTLAARPAASVNGRLYATTNEGIYLDNGTTWVLQQAAITGDVTISANGTTSTLATVNSNVGTFNNLTVNAKGLVTAASNVAYLTGNQTITASGDATGSGTTSIALTLASVNSNVGSFGSTSVVPIITVNGKGLITSVSTGTITPTSIGLGNVSNNLQVINAGGFVSAQSGLNSVKPTFGTIGRYYNSTDQGLIYRDDGSAWVAQTPAYTGDATSSVGDTTLTLATVNSNVGTFNNLTVNAKGLVTAASNVSYLTGNQTVTLTGDITGSGATGISTTLATVNSNVGTFGSTSVVPIITVNGKGLITSVSTGTITPTSIGLGNVVNNLQVINAGNGTSFASGTLVSRPTAGTNGRLYATTNDGIYLDNGTSWVLQQAAITGDITISANGTTATLATVNSNVGTFNNVTVNGKGLVTAASNVSYLTANQTITASGDVTGSGTTALPLTLATVNSNVGTFNNLTVNAKGLVTAASNVSYLTGNQTITLSGDFSGSGTTGIAGTLATVNSNVGSFGSSNTVPVVTVNGKGLVTAVSTSTITPTSIGLGNVVNNLQVINAGNGTSLASGTNAAKPVAGTNGRFYNSTDQGLIYFDNGTTWTAQIPAHTGDVTSTLGSTALTLATVNSNVGTFNNLTVNAKGLVTAASNVSYLTANQTITLSGDITGSGTTGIAGTLATVNSNVGSFGSTSVVPIITVNGKGLVTAVSTGTITPTSIGLGSVTNNLQVINAGGAVSYAIGTNAAKPAAGTAGRQYYSTDQGITYYDNGAAWAAKLPAYTGDATSSVGGTALTLATVNSNIGTFNNVTVNAKGLVTAASNANYLPDPGNNGILVRTALNTTGWRAIANTVNQTTVTNGDGVAGNPTIGIANNPVLPGTGSVTLPTGTTAQRDSAAVNGKLRWNSDILQVEVSDTNVYRVLGKIAQFLTGNIVQTTGTTILPHDATIPLSTEGFQIWTQTITPTYTNSTIVVIFDIHVESSVATTRQSVALFNGTTAISAASGYTGVVNTPMYLGINKTFSPGVVTPITLSARVGPSAAATVYVNRGNTETFGGTTNSSYIIMEII